MGTGHADLPTNTKVRIAQILSAGLRGGRALIGRGPVQRERRQGVEWLLDIREGIDLAIYLGIYEPHIIKALPSLVTPNAVVLDVGANVGAQTLPLAKLSGTEGRVVAVEPTAYAIGKLRQNLALNPDLEGRVTVVQAMLGASHGELISEIPSSWPLAGNRTGVDAEFAGLPKSTEGARAITLDQLVEELDLPSLDIIKIDVDGHELDVLSGAKRTLNRFAPSILIEMAPYLHDRKAGGFDALLEKITALGYEITDLATGARLDAWRDNFDTKVSGSRDVVLIPAKSAKAR